MRLIKGLRLNKKKAKKPKTKSEDRRKKKSPVAGALIFMVILLFLIVTALLLWIEGRFSALDRRLSETDKQLSAMSASRSTPAQAAPSTAASSAAPASGTVGPTEEIENDQEYVIGRVISGGKKGTSYLVTIDPAQLLTGKAASSIAAHRNTVPINGQYIDDATHSTRDISCSGGARVTAKGPGGGAGPKDAVALFAAVKGADAGYWKDVYFRMKVDNDYIVGFEQFTLE